MNNSLFYNHIEINHNNESIINEISDYAKRNPNQQIYLINAPLGEKYKYEYQEKAVVILSPKHKIIFLNLVTDDDNQELFEEYYEDFIEDLSSISDKFEYKDHIGRPRKWKNELTIKENYSEENTIEALLQKNTLDKKLKRKVELLISLLIGSINDIKKVGVDEPETILDKVKKNIILFDGDQTRFIYQNFQNKTVSIQGLSGTGKTELLLHKLKDIYIKDDDAKIFFTCHNVALANSLKERIPNFFNFMKVEKQIEWNSRLWVDRAWGSKKDKNSGLYSYLCHFYDIPFMRYSYLTDYNRIFSQVLEHLNKIDEDKFEYAFDYLLVDERQDFPKVFFEVCEKITRKKVYIVGDIFQDIFENTKDIELNVDVILNRCYRTDPRTLMFAHAIGMGLFESKKLNWFEDKYWEAIGYKIKRYENREIHLSREPIRRFEDLDIEKIKSMIIKKTTHVKDVIEIIKKIKENHPTVTPNDIAIIVLDDNQKIYEYIDTLSYKIMETMQWEINRAYETKTIIKDNIYITNPNNVKGLEFPFVICITGKLKNTYRYRNILYTMLTRSFIQSYLLVQNDEGIDVQEKGLKIINEQKYIKTIEPTEEEKEDIKNTLIQIKEQKQISYKEFLEKIYNELKIKKSCRQKFTEAIINSEIEEFDEVNTKKFIKVNKEFYCK